MCLTHMELQVQSAWAEEAAKTRKDKITEKVFIWGGGGSRGGELRPLKRIGDIKYVFS